MLPHPDPPPPASGPIDIHSHLLPGIDDGCDSLDETLQAIELLQAQGYVGTICTPHVWIELFPENTADNIFLWVNQLRLALAERDIDYTIWPGGEVRLFPGFVDYYKQKPIPTLAGTNRVLCDMFSDNWPSWVDSCFDLMLERGYQPILAHPERLNIGEGWMKHMESIREKGVWLQGNLEAFTGGLGLLADKYIRQLIQADGYTFLALDMHRPYSIPDRLDGRHLAIQELGQDAVDRYTVNNVRELILSPNVPADPAGGQAVSC